MYEIGGYIELDTYSLPILHKDAIALNCGRNALAYLIEANQIKKIFMPSFICSSIIDICKKYNIDIIFYEIDINFKPVSIAAQNYDWVYIVNYYGQLKKEQIDFYKAKFTNLIIDNAQAYFDVAYTNVHTIYTCRKFFGVSDGAFLYTNRKLDKDFPIDLSYNRINYILGRYEKTASEFYHEYVNNNKRFMDEPIKKMSKLTLNLLHALNYESISKTRKENFMYLHSNLKKFNNLNLIIPEGPFSYPFYINGGEKLRYVLQKKRIYIPTLWPNVLDNPFSSELEKHMALNILPLPIDQRYTVKEMDKLIKEIKKCID